MSLPITRGIGAALVTLCAIACTGAPKQAATEAPVAAPPATAVASNTAAPGNTAPADQEMVNGVTKEANAKLLTQGYKAVEHEGSYVYCRLESMTGTHIRQKVCLTETQIKKIEESARNTMNSRNRSQGGACTAGVSC